MTPFGVQQLLFLARLLGSTAVFPGSKFKFSHHLYMSFCKLSGSAQAPGFSRWKPCLMGAPIAAGKMRVLPSDFLALLNSVS